MKSIELNIEKALGTVSKSDVFALEDKAKSGMEMLHKGTGKGNDFLGWLHLPSEITEAHLADLEAAAKQLKDRCEIVVVIGIGFCFISLGNVGINIVNDISVGPDDCIPLSGF
jgi:glucose-6-phosphate isomerase